MNGRATVFRGTSAMIVLLTHTPPGRSYGIWYTVGILECIEPTHHSAPAFKKRHLAHGAGLFTSRLTIGDEKVTWISGEINII